MGFGISADTGLDKDGNSTVKQANYQAKRSSGGVNDLDVGKLLAESAPKRLGGGDTCLRCRKEVFFAEKVKALGSEWWVVLVWKISFCFSIFVYIFC